MDPIRRWEDTATPRLQGGQVVHVLHQRLLDSNHSGRARKISSQTAASPESILRMITSFMSEDRRAVQLKSGCRGHGYPESDVERAITRAGLSSLKIPLCLERRLRRR
jgi:hypothetical protein